MIWLLIEIVLAVYLLGVVMSLVFGSIGIYMVTDDKRMSSFAREWAYRVPRALPQILLWPVRFGRYFAQFFRR